LDLVTMTPQKNLALLTMVQQDVVFPC